MSVRPFSHQAIVSAAKALRRPPRRTASRADGLLRRLLPTVVTLGLLIAGGASTAAAGSEPPISSSAPAVCAPAACDPPPACCGHCDCDVWLVDARACSCRPDGAPILHFWRYVDGRKVPSSIQEFLATCNPARPEVFWVHGNRVEPHEAPHVGWTMYRGLCKQACSPFRFVIWSWPASQIHGQIKDVRYKAGVADAEAYDLAWMIDRLPPYQPAGLLGYSFGGRLIGSALHLLGGGQIGGRMLYDRLHPDRLLVPAALLAAATDFHALSLSGRNSLALLPADRVLVTVNPADRVLKLYPRLFGRGGPAALGAVGPAGYPGPQGMKVQTVPVSGLIGKTHDWEAYAASPPIMARAAHVLLFSNFGSDWLPPSAPRRESADEDELLTVSLPADSNAEADDLLRDGSPRSPRAMQLRR